MRFSKISVFFVALGAVMFGVIIIPIGGLFAWQIFDFEGLASAAGNFEVMSAVGLSCFAAFLAVLVSLVLGIPLAYTLARKEFKGKKIVESVIDVPVVIPHTVAGIALLIVFGVFGGTVAGIVVAMTFVSAPLLISSAVEGFRDVDPKLEKVARTLGASEWQAFSKIALPLAFPHILSGAILAWARAISEFAAIIMLVGYYPMIATGLIWRKFYTGGLPAALPIAVILIIVCLVVFFILRKWRGRL